ncbi:hypothetical protein [Listeria booriae]|uniref:Uncharacterized protein n=1 Tax=Listeria booriae TaxID=1552123 RepID=A0A7X1CXV5_9LIST|nr:hypothetical protein [Listeria booriae]MBC1290605.1 hypothetical protein [Listeria booriae]MBC2115703.1 hypothetical protein [Listeria booriae]
MTDTKTWRIIIAFFKALLCAILLIVAIGLFAVYTDIFVLVIVVIAVLSGFASAWRYFYEEG